RERRARIEMVRFGQNAKEKSMLESRGSSREALDHVHENTSSHRSPWVCGIPSMCRCLCILSVSLREHVVAARDARDLAIRRFHGGPHGELSRGHTCGGAATD